MPARHNKDVIQTFLGATQVLASALEQVVENKLLEEVAGRQFTPSQFRLLRMVALTDAQTIGDVALFLGVSNPAASKAVDKLVRRRFLGRSEAEADRREIRLALTPSSRKLLAAYEQVKERKLARVFRQFPVGDLERTARLMDRLSAGLIDHTARPEEICLQCGIYYREECLVRQLVRQNCFYQRNKSRTKPHRASAARSNGRRPQP